MLVEVMRDLVQAMLYFGTVFATGFALALIRVPFLEPRYGVRLAELPEIPVMLVVIAFTSRWLHRRNAFLSAPHFLRIGGSALLLMISAEVGLALVTSGLSLAEYISSKDPVSGSAYLLSLVAFALAPWFWSIKGRV